MSSRIDDLRLVVSNSTVKADDIIDFELSFKVDGEVRQRFNQTVWSDAYDKHDNLFRVKYVLNLGYEKGALMEPVTLVRKASFYWSRNPKLPPPPPNKKIWAMIVIDESPVIPISEEHARTLLFDVKYSMLLSGSRFEEGEHKVYAKVIASWGKHTFIVGEEISKKSEPLIIRRV